MTTVTLFSSLEHRRRQLGMSCASLAARSNLSLPTVQRILSGNHANSSFANINAIAEALGMSMDLKPSIDAEQFREQQASKKASQLIRLVQGTSALEGQAVDRGTFEKMVRQTVHDLLAGSKRKLWAE